jgi:hypothetical protein
MSEKNLNEIGIKKVRQENQAIGKQTVFLKSLIPLLLKRNKKTTDLQAIDENRYNHR